jgi:hypothetical protein
MFCEKNHESKGKNEPEPCHDGATIFSVHQAGLFSPYCLSQAFYYLQIIFPSHRLATM